MVVGGGRAGVQDGEAGMGGQTLPKVRLKEVMGSFWRRHTYVANLPELFGIETVTTEYDHVAAATRHGRPMPVLEAYPVVHLQVRVAGRRAYVDSWPVMPMPPDMTKNVIQETVERALAES